MKDEKKEEIKKEPEKVDEVKIKSNQEIEKEQFDNDVKGYLNDLRLASKKFNLALQPIITEVGPNFKLIRPPKQEEKLDIIK